MALSDADTIAGFIVKMPITCEYHMPKKKKKPRTAEPVEWSLSPQIVFRLNDDLRTAAEDFCREHGIDSASELARIALATYIGRPELAGMRSRGRKWPEKN